MGEIRGEGEVKMGEVVVRRKKGGGAERERRGESGEMCHKLCCVSEFMCETRGSKCHVIKRRRGGE